jgi:hypothetical protein
VIFAPPLQARLAQPAERKALNLVVVGSSPTVGVFPAPRDGPRGRCVGQSKQQSPRRHPSRRQRPIPASGEQAAASCFVRLGVLLAGPWGCVGEAAAAGQVVRRVGDAAAAGQVAGRALPQAGLYVDQREWSHAGLNRGPYGYWPYALTS